MKLGDTVKAFFLHEVIFKCFRMHRQHLTTIKMGYCPVAVQLAIQFFILAFHFNSFSVEVNGVHQIFLSVCIISFTLVNLCYCWNKDKTVR